MTAREVLEAIKTWEPDLREDFFERASILEYDACLSREAAELAAYWALKPQTPMKQTELELEATR